MIWLTADWHLGEDRFDLLQRPFESVDEHIDFLIEKHNSVVNPEDKVIVIGDAVYQRNAECVKHISRFNGRKTLIRGNHDSVIDDVVYSKYFETIVAEGMCLDCHGVMCYLNHYPSRGKADMFNLVGHIHGAWKYQLNMFNVGVDVNHFLPVATDKIPFHFDAVARHYNDEVWIAYHDINNRYYGVRGRKI